MSIVITYFASHAADGSNGPVNNVFGPFEDYDVAREWADANLRTTFTVEDVQAPFNA